MQPTSSQPPSIRHGITVQPGHELAPTTGQAGPVQRAAAIRERNRGEIRETLGSMFRPHITAGNRERFDALMDNRSDELANMGQSRADVLALRDKGESWNKLFDFGVGAVNSASFGAAGVVTGLVPGIGSAGGRISDPGVQNMINGVIFVAFNTIGVNLLSRATSNTRFATAKDHELDPVMAEAAKKTDSSMLEKIGEGAGTVQTFTGRTVLMSGIQALVNKTVGPAAAAHVGTVSSGVGAPLAGAFMQLSQGVIDGHKHRTGFEYLLSRQNDWKEKYTELQNYSPGKAILNGGKRMSLVPMDALQDLTKSLQALFTPKGLVAEFGVLGGGIAAAEKLRSLASASATEKGWSSTAVLSAGNATAASAYAVVFAAWVAAGVLTPPVAAKVDALMTKIRGGDGVDSADVEGLRTQLLTEEEREPARPVAASTISTSVVRDQAAEDAITRMV